MNETNKIIGRRKKAALLLRLSWQVCPSYLLLLLLNTAVSGGQLLAAVVLPKFLLDELTGGREADRLLFFAGCIVAGNLLFAWLAKLLKRGLDVKGEYVNHKMEELLGEKIMNLSYVRLEDPYYLDLKERAAFVFVNQQAMLQLVNETGEFLKNGTTLVLMAAILLTLSPVLLVCLLMLVGVMILLQKRFYVYQKQMFDAVLPVNRRYNYYVNLAFDGKLQKDIRLYGMAGMLGQRIVDCNRDIMDTFDFFYKKEGLYMGLYGVINDLQAALAYGYVALRVATGWFGQRLSLGSFSMYVSAAVQFSSGITKFGESLLRVGQMLSYLDPFIELMNLPDEKEQKEGEIFSGTVESICFEHVDFTYPGSSKKVLDDISFSVNKGEKISVVGVNGAGKSTLIKLLCRLYRPDDGRILVNGRDIFTYEYESYMRQVAAVFQDYRLFAFTVGENISCRAVGEDRERILRLAGQVGLSDKLDALPRGIDTLIGKQYDETGTELSGGQEQKVAIARALYKNASLIILDEPTSALDPLAEAEIYENFHELTGDKTAFYISHRMSSSLFCDRILVIDGGKVADFDSHENLMKKEGIYRKLFQTQADNYAG